MSTTEEHGRGPESRAALLGELETLGYPAADLKELVRRHAPFPSAVSDVLLAWVPRLTNERSKEMVIRALAASGEPLDGAPLAEAFTASKDMMFQWAVGNTLSEVECTGIDDWLLTTLAAPEFGMARQMVAIAVARNVPSDRAVPALLDVLDEMTGHAAIALGLLAGEPASTAAVGPLRAAAASTTGWAKKELNKAIAAIEAKAV